MADKTETVTNSPEHGQQVERAQVAPDGTVTVPNCEAKLTSVDVADVDLLLGFADGTYVVIPNGALDALSDSLHTVVFVDKDDSAFDEAHFSSDHQTSLGDLFKMVGTTDLAKAGSLRVVSEHVDADIEVDEVVVTASDQTSVVLPGLVQVSTGGNSPGGGPLITNAELINPDSTDPVAPEILQRPSVFTPGKVTKNVDPAIWLDPNVTSDDIINLAESDPANMVTISGQVGGTAAVNDTVTVTVGSYSVDTQVLSDMTFSVDIPGNHFPYAGGEVDATITASDGATEITHDQYAVDVNPPDLTIVLNSVASDDVVNIAESLGIVTITGTVSEFRNDDLAGDQITLTINGSPFYGIVDSDGQNFSIDVPGTALAPTPGVEGVTGTIDARIDSVDNAGNTGFGEALGGQFSIDTLKLALPVITVDDVTTGNTINISESGSDVVVTGSVVGAQVGDEVTMSINGIDYASLVRSDDSFSINVLGSDLIADPNSSVVVNITTYDTARNPSTGSVEKFYGVDIDRPTATINVDDASLNIGDSALVTITFDDSVTNFTNADLTIANGTLTPVSSVDGGKTWTATLTPDSLIEDTTNVITLNDAGVEDLAGNTGVGTTDSNNYAVDTIAPTVSDVTVNDLQINDSDVGNTLSVAVTFSEMMDTTVDPSLSFGVDISGSLSSTGGTWNAAGTVYIETYVITDDGFDSANITVDVTGALDTNGNVNQDYTAEAEFSIDTLNPTVVIVDDNLDGVVSPMDNVVNYTLTFSEEVTSISILDLAITGGNLTLDPVLSLDGLSATFSVTADDKSDVDLVVTVNDTIVDMNGNNLVPASNTLPVDTLNPRVTISTDNVDGVVSDGDIVVQYTLTFSTEVVSVSAGDLTIVGGVLLADPVFSADMLSATFSVIADDNSNIPLEVTVNNTITDLFGRPLMTESSLLPVDTINAIVTITDDNVDFVVSDDDSVVNYTVTFSEEVSALTDSDLTISGGTLSGSPILSADGLSATFQVTANDDSIDDLSVTLNSSVVDLNGNPVVAENSTLSVDTVNPTIDNVTVNRVSISDSDVGAYNLRVTIAFSEAVDTSVLPTLTFSPDLSSSISNTGDYIWGNNDTRFVAYFNILDAGVEFDNVTIDITGVQDIHGNLLQDYMAQPEIIIDTQNPTVLIGHNNLDGVVSDEDSQVDYTLTFSEEVASLSTSDLQISGGLLTAGPVLAADGLSATFSVIAENESSVPLNVTVMNTITDLHGNSLESATSSLTVDTIDLFPDCVARLFTSQEFKVNGGAGAPAGSYVPGATYNEQVLATSPAGQAARDRIDGTGLDDSIMHNPAFSVDPGTWSKTLHLDFTVYDDISTIELIAGSEIIGISGFNIEGINLVWDGANTWTLTPDAAMSADIISNGLDLNVVYDVADSGGPIDFLVALNVSGTDAGVVYDINKTLDFSWREATAVEDFDITSASGNQVMVLPRDGFGVDIYAGGGDDNVIAGAGHDLLVGGAGGDILDGGAGKDTASFAGSTAGVNASLMTGLGNGGDAEGDQYFNIENLTGGDWDDILIGDGNDNILDGGDGDDTLIGGAALTGDTLIGGIGNDTVSYAGSVDAVSASLVTNSGSGGDAAGDSYTEIENLTGGAGADTLIGDGNDNVLNGGADGDNLQGGGGIDTASYADASSGVIAALDSSLWMFQSGDALGDTFDQIENLLGSNHNDTLFGDSSDNSLDGGLGNDTLNAGAGDDTIYANQGNDTARGGVGNDTIHVSSDGVDLPVQVDGGAGTDVLVVEGLVNVVGNYDFTDLAGLDSRLENIETLDIRGDGADSLIEITGQDVLNMVDTGTQLTVLADSGDTLDLSAFGAEGEGVTSVAIADGTEYTIDVGGVDIATINWLTV